NWQSTSSYGTYSASMHPACSPLIEFVRFNFGAEEEVAAISEKVPDHKTIARLQLADARDVLEGIQDVKGVSFPILTPNLK
ncbi:hypothetical protein S83_069600, partial [Arachis hypogaea]